MNQTSNEPKPRMYVCVYVCVYVLHVCIVCMYVCMYVHTYVFMYVCTKYVYMGGWLNACMLDLMHISFMV